MEALQKKLSDTDQAKNDFENKLIQEKLKHHHTTGDLQKAKETLEETQKSLTEEIEARKLDLQKMEDYKKRLLENEKKTKEYKKTIKKLSQKILELQEKITASEAKPKEDSMTKENTEEAIATDEDNKATADTPSIIPGTFLLNL
jgi:hypothetical protein